ncbi:hypothetical protein SDC9_162216 [bioreactor metagenome]|uniref:Uncharacterized protein n=1 Tax=bioreactor metagenome TaxID=1076179 RepID=A0A645FKF0_9ZZZZ
MHGSVHRYFGSGFDQENIAHIDLIHIHFLELAVFHLLQRALRSHFRQLTDGGSGFIQRPLLQVCSEQEEKGYDGRFLKVTDDKGTGHSDGNQDIDADHLDSQCLISLDCNGSHSDEGCDDQRPDQDDFLMKEPFSQEPDRDQNPAEPCDLIFVF